MSEYGPIQIVPYNLDNDINSNQDFDQFSINIDRKIDLLINFINNRIKNWLVAVVKGLFS